MGKLLTKHKGNLYSFIQIKINDFPSRGFEPDIGILSNFVKNGAITKF